MKASYYTCNRTFAVESIDPVAPAAGEVAIHSEKKEVDLLRFFWREIELLGARVYTGADFDTAIELVAAGAIDCDSIITNVQDIGRVGDVLADLSDNPSALKSLIRVCDEEVA